jgi:hypothetical protein
MKRHQQKISKFLFALNFRWRPPRYFQNMPEEKFERIRKKWHILVEGEDIPPPIKHFKVNPSYPRWTGCLSSKKL